MIKIFILGKNSEQNVWKKKFAIFETEGKKTRIKVFSKKTLFTFLQSFKLVEDGIDDMIDVQTNL